MVMCNGGTLAVSTNLKPLSHIAEYGLPNTAELPPTMVRSRSGARSAVVGWCSARSATVRLRQPNVSKCLKHSGVDGRFGHGWLVVGWCSGVGRGVVGSQI